MLAFRNKDTACGHWIPAFAGMTGVFCSYAIALTYRGIVLWHGHRRSVRIIESEGAPLIGTELLWGSLLTAEMTDNGAVTIGPLTGEVSG